MKYVKLLIAIFVAPIVAVIIYMVAAGAISETVTTEDEPASKSMDAADAATEASTEAAVTIEARGQAEYRTIPQESESSSSDSASSSSSFSGGHSSGGGASGSW